MTDRAEPSGSDRQRSVASDCNNAAWALIEQPSLDSTDIAQLLMLAATARHHWHEIGNPSNVAHADLLFAWALARAGVAGASALLADKALSYFEDSGAIWEQAFAHAAMAAACGADHDTDGFQRHHSKAEELGAELSGPDAVHFHAAFKTVLEVPNEVTS